MIQGQITPDVGSIRVGNTVKLAVVDQDREGLDGDRSVFDEICNGLDVLQLGDMEMNSRAYATMFGFKGADQKKRVSALSGGERNRCQLAKIVKSGANVIILDEVRCCDDSS
jgi:energy-dependent translational throttle protein EttA